MDCYIHHWGFDLTNRNILPPEHYRVSKNCLQSLRKAKVKLTVPVRPGCAKTLISNALLALKGVDRGHDHHSVISVFAIPRYMDCLCGSQT